MLLVAHYSGAMGIDDACHPKPKRYIIVSVVKSAQSESSRLSILYCVNGLVTCSIKNMVWSDLI